MYLPDRRVLLGMGLGAVCATAIAAIGPGMVFEALADEFAPTGIDAASLVKFEDRDYVVDYEDWVATDPLTTARVTKVEAGKVSYVTITTTATGTYSTDAMFSNHVQYPGISVEPDPSDIYNRFSYWSRGKWFSFGTAHGDSFFYYHDRNVGVSRHGDTSCVSGKGFRVC
ncbi:hypothetical protein JI749_15740 [Devosia oryziradicis]|uniref:Tat pathway signal sequence domain protein n=1 Tax=Devosia oryziradicis TaxID=2801335 RepID=A0ABX7BUZ5_9HYPH|nr:hypothetical protein [Devosia oryziradicis]QQR35779.1 hypothetical protein JI749_15740 [Devosia oryziradicis]